MCIAQLVLENGLEIDQRLHLVGKRHKRLSQSLHEVEGVHDRCGRLARAQPLAVSLHLSACDCPPSPLVFVLGRKKAAATGECRILSSFSDPQGCGAGA